MKETAFSPCIMCVIMSTSGGVQYIGGISWVHRGDIMSTSGGYHDTCGGIPWVHGGCSVHRGDNHEYIGGISWVHRGDIMSTSEDVQYIGVFNRNWKDFIKLLPHMYHDIPPMYWTSPDVLMISPRCTHGIPPMYWTSPDVLMVSPPRSSWYPSDVLNIPRCTHDIPPMYSWYPPDVLNTPRCTEHPPMYWTHIIQGDFVRRTRVYHGFCNTVSTIGRMLTLNRYKLPFIYHYKKSLETSITF